MQMPLSSADLVDALQRLGFRQHRRYATGVVLEGERNGRRRVVVVEEEAEMRIERLAVLLAAADLTFEDFLGLLAAEPAEPAEPSTLTRRVDGVREEDGDGEPTNHAA